jgi:hypothetical protein
MRKKLSLGAILALLSAMCVGVAFAQSSVAFAQSSPSTVRSDSGNGSEEVIHLTDKSVDTVGFNLEPVISGEFTFTDDVFRDDTKVGIDGGKGKWVRVDEDAEEATAQIDLTVRLDDRGQITAEGLFTFADEPLNDQNFNDNEEIGRFAITGGTDDFRTARGEIVVTATDDPNVVNLEVRVIR